MTGSTRLSLARVVLVSALGVPALQCNTFDDPPEQGGDAPFEPFPVFPTQPPVVTELPQPVTPALPPPPVVTTLPVPPTATTLPGAIDGGLPPEDTTATSGDSSRLGETLGSATSDTATLGSATPGTATFDAGTADAGRFDAGRFDAAAHPAPSATSLDATNVALEAGGATVTAMDVATDPPGDTSD